MQAEAVVREGMVEIPLAIRDILALGDGDTLVFDADEGGVRLRTRPRSTRGSFQDVVGIFGNANEGKSIERILAEEREARGY